MSKIFIKKRYAFILGFIPLFLIGFFSFPFIIKMINPIDDYTVGIEEANQNVTINSEVLYEDDKLTIRSLNYFKEIYGIEYIELEIENKTENVYLINDAGNTVNYVSVYSNIKDEVLQPNSIKVVKISISPEENNIKFMGDGKEVGLVVFDLIFTLENGTEEDNIYVNDLSVKTNYFDAIVKAKVDPGSIIFDQEGVVVTLHPYEDGNVYEYVGEQDGIATFKFSVENNTDRDLYFALNKFTFNGEPLTFDENIFVFVRAHSIDANVLMSVYNESNLNEEYKAGNYLKSLSALFSDDELELISDFYNVEFVIGG